MKRITKSLAAAAACAGLLVTGCGDSSGPGPQATTKAYVEHFYPLWFNYYQSAVTTINRLAGPDEITPLYHIVVAINDDTVYVSTFLNLHTEPVVLTVPSTQTTYSVLTLDPYGNIFDTGITEAGAQTFALFGPEWTGTLPKNLVAIHYPLDFTTLIFRVDRYSPSGEDQTNLADTFRRSLLLATWSEYMADPSAGATSIFPAALTAEPFKTVADNLVATDPITFLSQLQIAVDSSNTPPLSASEQQLANRFNRQFANRTDSNTSKFAAGAQQGHAAIVDAYLSNTGPTNWIHFTNIGAWGDDVVQRAAITEFIQYGNGNDTAAYYQTFVDGDGDPLDASNGQTYVLTFPAGELPDAERFWSVTAYTPNDIELVANPLDKYVVASYTPALQTNPDGSVSIYMAYTQPAGVAETNWLPVPSGPFNIMLRVYGPEGSVADDTYVPPAVAAL